MSTTQEEAVPVVNEVTVSGTKYSDVIKKLLSEGAKRLNDIRIKNVNHAEMDNYTRVTFTLGTQIRGFISEDNGETYKEGLTNNLFTSLYAIAGALKEDEELGWMANALLEHPAALNLIMNGATVDVIQQYIKAGDEYVNPFTTQENKEGTVYDHDVIINNIVRFKLGKTGNVMANKLADKLLGF